MSKIIDELDEEISLNLEDELGELADDDYVFVVKSYGTLKNIMFPVEDQFEYSQKILAIFKAIGIENPEILLEQTMH